MYRNRHRTRVGFTLVELLVVVAIIALLLSILLPSLARAREQAKKVKCLANFKDVGSSSVVYASDAENDILVPGPRRKTTAGGWFWGAQHFGGKGGSPDLVSANNWKDAWTIKGGFGPGDRPLNKVLFKNPTWESYDQAEQLDHNLDDLERADASLSLETFKCPSDVGLPPNTGALSDEWGGVLANAEFVSDTPYYDIMGNSYTTHWLTPLITSGSYPFSGWGAYNRKITSVPDAARCVTYREGSAFAIEFWNSIYPPFAAISQDLEINGWHGGLMEFQAAFADGHADTIAHRVRTNVVGSDIFGLTLNLGEWEFRGCRAESVNLPEPLNFVGVGAAFTLIRGEGWQMDYFPAPMNIVIADASEGPQAEP